jgi:hypothetical protein
LRRRDQCVKRLRPEGKERSPIERTRRGMHSLDPVIAARADAHNLSHPASDCAHNLRVPALTDWKKSGHE